jgi:hypothetical protein
MLIGFSLTGLTSKWRLSLFLVYNFLYLMLTKKNTYEKIHF